MNYSVGSEADSDCYPCFVIWRYMANQLYIPKGYDYEFTPQQRGSFNGAKFRIHLDDNGNFDNNKPIWNWNLYKIHSNAFFSNVTNTTNALTTHFALEKTIDYFNTVHHYVHQQWLNYNVFSSDLTNEFSPLGYAPDFGTGQSTPSSIYRFGAHSSIVGHELGHRFNFRKNFYTEMDEGTSDIWGANIAAFAFGETELDWVIYGLLGSDFSRRLDKYWHINRADSDPHQRGHIISYVYFVLSQGHNGNVNPNFPEQLIEVCGIGHIEASRIFERAHTALEDQGGFLNTGSIIDGYIEYRDLCINAVDELEVEGGIFIEGDFVRAQIQNAFARVGIGTPNLEMSAGERVQFCQGVAASLAASSEYGGVIEWKKDNNVITDIIVNGNEIIVNFPNPTDNDSGIYTATLTYTDNSGVELCETIREVEVEVQHLIIDDLTEEELTPCIGEEVVITRTHHPAAYELNWSIVPNISFNESGEELTFTPTSIPVSGYYEVTLSGKCNVNGIPNDVSDVVQIYIQQPPLIADVQIGINKDPEFIPIEGENPSYDICLGETISLQIYSGEILHEYEWMNDANLTINNPEYYIIDVSPTETTTFTVSITNKCGSISKDITVNVSGGANTIDLGEPQDICRFEILQGPDGYDSYSWSGDFVTFNGKDIQVNDEASNEPYTYTLTATINGCQATGSIELTVLDFPEEDIPNVDLSGEGECNPSNPITLTESENNIYKHWEWRQQGNALPLQEGNGTSVNNLVVKSPGTYTLMIQSTTSICEFESTHDVTYADIGILGNMDIKPNDPLNDYWAASSLTSDNVITIEGLITVKPGATLIIKGGTVVQFIGKHSGIIVNRGGRLEANNVEFNVSDCEGDTFWKGLEVVGNHEIDHPTNYLQNSNPNHGLIKLRGGHIANATTAISSAFLDDALPVTGLFGGGIVDVNGVTFENNLKGIFLAGTTYANEESKIKNCHFLNSAPFQNPINGQQYEQIVLHGMEMPILIQANTFEASTSMSGKERGTGIRVEEAAYVIGHGSCLDLGNEFIHTYQGIEVVSMGVAHTETSIVNNSFEDVDKGITLNSSIADIVQFNTFELPAPELANDDSYAILTNGSGGFTIEENTIHNSLPGANDIEGIVVIDSNIGGVVGGSSFNNNSVTGSLEVGTQFEGNNQNINMDCNSYSGFMMDWYIDWGAEIGVIQSNTVQVGECDDTDESLALRNIWNDSNQTIFHLFNNNNQGVNLNVATQYQPDNNLLNGFAMATSDDCLLAVDNCEQSISLNCNVILGHHNIEIARPIDPIHLPTPVTFTELTNGKSITNPASGQVFSGLGKLQGAFWQMMDGTCDRACAIQLLTAQNEEWSKRLLVATYHEKQEVATANNLLASLPTHDTQAIQYYSIMDMLLNYPLDANTESNLLSLAANPHDRYIQTLAESALSIYFGHRFVRSANPIDFNGASKKAVKEDWASITFQLQPNPAKDQLNITIQRQNIFLDVLKISIFDTNGKHWQTIEIPENQTQFHLDLSSIPTGMYFCRLYSEEENFGMQKMMIIK